MMQIKLIPLINELQINNPRVTSEKVHEYWKDNIWNNLEEFGSNSQGWREYIELCKPYCEKYNINYYIESYDFKKLSQQDLNKLYYEMRQLVKKHTN